MLSVRMKRLKMICKKVFKLDQMRDEYRHWEVVALFFLFLLCSLELTIEQCDY